MYIIQHVILVFLASFNININDFNLQLINNYVKFETCKNSIICCQRHLFHQYYNYLQLCLEHLKYYSNNNAAARHLNTSTKCEVGKLYQQIALNELISRSEWLRSRKTTTEYFQSYFDLSINQNSSETIHTLN